MCYSVDWLLYNRQALQGKVLTITSTIPTYLQLVHVYLIICQFLVILALKYFAFGSFLGSMEKKVFVPYFKLIL